MHKYTRTSLFITELKKHKKICFVGDSITEGTMNGGIGWFEPLLYFLPDVKYEKFAKGSETSNWLVENREKISSINASLFIIAIGCNDIRYRDPERCAMTPEGYIKNISKVVDTILDKQPSASFIFISPWRSLSFDANFNVKDYQTRDTLYNAYNKILKEYCKINAYKFIDPNPLIFNNLSKPSIHVKEGNDILIDFIHPNGYKGVNVYANAVIEAYLN